MRSRTADPDARKRSTRATWIVYILRCRDGSLYTGCTNDLRRLVAHGSGKGARYTRSRLPVELVFQERCGDRSAALRREAAIKRLSRAEKLALVGSGRSRGRRSRTGQVRRVPG